MLGHASQASWVMENMHDKSQNLPDPDIFAFDRTALRAQNDELQKTRTVLRTMLEQAECRALQAQNAMTVRAHEARLSTFQEYKIMLSKIQKNAFSAIAAASPAPANDEKEQTHAPSAAETEVEPCSAAKGGGTSSAPIKIKPSNEGTTTSVAVPPAKKTSQHDPTLPNRASAGPAVHLYGVGKRRLRRKFASSGEAASGSAGGASSAETPEAAAGATVEASVAEGGTAAVRRPPRQELGTTSGTLWRADQRPSKIETKMLISNVKMSGSGRMRDLSYSFSMTHEVWNAGPGMTDSVRSFSYLSCMRNCLPTLSKLDDFW